MSKAGLALGAGGALLGSLILATASEIGAVEKFLATFGVLAALVWFMWHNQTKVIPSLNRSHRDDIDKLCKQHSEGTERICQRFAEATERIEQHHSEQLSQACRFRGD